jgi:tRNA-splicing ligase RtcB (3'-phosphate/5'-hydroxy nucleic acid ligase)
MKIIGNNKIIMTDERQENAIEQLQKIINHPAFKYEKVRVMPDYHCGAGVVIGFTSTYSDIIIPNVVGVDIGCGVITYKLGNMDIDFQTFDDEVRKRIPLGFNHRKNLDVFEQYGEHCDPWLQDFEQEFAESDFREGFTTHRKDAPKLAFGDIRLQLGTLGGGNHFIEMEQDSDGEKYLSIHSGSRNFGLRVAKSWQDHAKHLMDVFRIRMDKDLEFLPMEFGGQEYVDHMVLAQHFASMNRRFMLWECLDALGVDFHESDFIESVHNYIDTERGIIRKGAIEADSGKDLIIPLNMRDGIVVGKGVSDETILKNWNYSAPHGAGRIMSRKQAHRTLSVDDFTREMQGIWSTSVGEATLDEAPMVYKDADMIVRDIAEVVNVEKIIKPIYSLKSDQEAF